MSSVFGRFSVPTPASHNPAIRRSKELLPSPLDPTIIKSFPLGIETLRSLISVRLLLGICNVT